MGSFVLGLARTGLIFTRIQEGAQPGGLAQPQPGQTEPGIPYHVLSRWVPVGGRHGGNCLAVRERAASVLSGRAGLFCGLFCRVFSLPVSLLLLFPLFAVQLNCPYPDHPVSASFFSFSSAPRRGEGRPRGAFVAGGSRNENILLKPWHRNNGSLWRGRVCFS